MNKKHYPLIRTIYLYLFTLIGLILVIIAGVRFLDMGLKYFIFTKAEQQQRIAELKPPIPYSLELERIEKIEEDDSLTEKQKQAINQWLKDYKNWEEKNEEMNPVTSRRHREASYNLAMILIGLPLYFYHWHIIKKETRD